MSVQNPKDMREERIEGSVSLTGNGSAALIDRKVPAGTELILET